MEFTLVGIPLICGLISTVEMARGMWIYHTQAFAINEGARYVVAHGTHCTSNGNSCTVTVGQIASRIAASGSGLIPALWNVTLLSGSGSNNVTCNPLSNCLTNSTVWPPSPDNTVGTGIAVMGSYPFASALVMFFPSTGTTSFGIYNLPAYSRQIILF